MFRWGLQAKRGISRLPRGTKRPTRIPLAIVQTTPVKHFGGGSSALPARPTHAHPRNASMTSGSGLSRRGFIGGVATAAGYLTLKSPSDLMASVAHAESEARWAR